MASNEYFSYINSPEWKGKSRFFRSLTNNRCSIFPWLKATDAHHLTYDNLRDEYYIKDCIPVSRFVHNIIHNNPIGKFFWDDIRGRRRIMNHTFRAIAVLVTIGAMVYTMGILPVLKVYRMAIPKATPKPKLKRNRGRSHAR